MALSIIDAQRDLILKTLLETVKASWKILVLDEKSRKILDNVLDIRELMKHYISHTEFIEDAREASTDEAVYIITPRPEVFDRLVADLTHRRYTTIHLIWTSSSLSKPLSPSSSSDSAVPNDAYRARLTSNPAFQSILGDYNVLNIEYFPQESHLVTFRDPWETIYLFHPLCAGLIQKHVEDIAQKIVGVCVALGEYPQIRYFQPSHDSQNLMDAARSFKAGQPSRDFRFLVDSMHPVQWSCALLAKLVQDELDLYTKFHPKFPPANNRPRATLYITDRTMDVIAPLLHDFHYQAMICDLLPIYRREKLEFKTTINEGRPDEEVKYLPIREADELWVEYRHRHMKDTLDGLNSRFAQYMKDNSIFTRSDQGAASLSRIKAMMAGLPEFQEQKEKYSLHLSMMESAMKLYIDRNLSELALLEQNLGNGLDANHKPPKNMADQMVRMLDDDKVIPLDRLRLLALYMLHKDGLLPADLDKLIQHSKIEPHKIERVSNFDLLGSNTQRRLKEYRSRPPPVFPNTEPRPVNPPETYALGRYKTAIEMLLARHATNKIGDDIFPYTRPPLDDGGDEAANAPPASLRTAKATWAQPRRNKMASETRQRIIIYMTAGATYSESKACYDASTQLGKEVILMTSHMLSTDLYLRQVGHLTEQIGKLEPPLVMQALRERLGPRRAYSESAPPPPPASLYTSGSAYRSSSHSVHRSPQQTHRQSANSGYGSVPHGMQPPPPPPPPSFAMANLELGMVRPPSDAFTASPHSAGSQPPNSVLHKLDKKEQKRMREEAEEAEKLRKKMEKAERKKNKSGLFNKK